MTRLPGQFPPAVLVGLVATCWLAIGIGFYEANWDISFFKPMSGVVLVVSVALGGFDRWLWRWKLVERYHSVPNLNGTWRGELRSSWTDPQTGHPTPAIPIVLVIRQTYSAISVRAFTTESSSVTVAANVELEAEATHLVTYVFRNEPRLLVQDRSRTAYGGARLQLAGAKDRLEGSYWTDRGPHGELRVVRVSRDHVLDFQSGAALAGAGATQK